MLPPVPRSEIDAVRAFNRLYTRRIGALDGGHLGSRFSLTEVRVLFELAHSPGLTAGELGDRLGIDPGYLSRMLAGFARRRLIRRAVSRADRRATHLSLTTAGRAAFAPLDRRANEAVRELLGEIPPAERTRMLDALQTVHRALDPARRGEVRFRAHRPGDMGWIVHRHGVLYSREYGYDERFEAIVARVVADFIDHLDPQRERCWIADRDGEIVGSIFLVKKTSRVAKLRLLYLEPHVRGLGVGGRLVDECIGFAREAGYRQITLWTQSSLKAARHIYQSRGFQLTTKTAHNNFGPTEEAETWDLTIR